VDYGQSIKGLEYSVVNDTKDTIKVNFKIFARYGSEVVKTLVDDDFTIPPQNRELVFGPTELKITKSIFKQPGPYVLASKLVNLENADKLRASHFM